MGATAQAHRDATQAEPARRRTSSIQETPRALHQPYLKPTARRRTQFFTEPTGVFNTAELLVNQLGLTPGVSHGDWPGLQLLLNHYVEDVQNHGDHFELVTRNTLTGRDPHVPRRHGGAGRRLDRKPETAAPLASFFHGCRAARRL